MEWIQGTIGFSAAVITTASFVPQLVKAYRTKSVEDFSWIMLIGLSFGITLWLVYGIFRSDLAIILANGVTLCLVITLQILKIRYNRHAHVRNL
jgi:MtN3 and saliva related transmembrane protein